MASCQEIMGPYAAVVSDAAVRDSMLEFIREDSVGGGVTRRTGASPGAWLCLFTRIGAAR